MKNLPRSWAAFNAGVARAREAYRRTPNLDWCAKSGCWNEAEWLGVCYGHYAVGWEVVDA